MYICICMNTGYEMKSFARAGKILFHLWVQSLYLVSSLREFCVVQHKVHLIVRNTHQARLKIQCGSVCMFIHVLVACCKITNTGWNFLIHIQKCTNTLFQEHKIYTNIVQSTIPVILNSVMYVQHLCTGESFERVVEKIIFEDVQFWVRY